MSRKLTLSALLFLALFLFVQIADAALLRSSGRGSRSLNFSQHFYFVENQYLNNVGIKANTSDPLFSTPDPSLSYYKRIGGGGRGVTAVPTALNAGDNSCVNGYTQDQVNDIDNDESSAINAFNNAPNVGDLTNAEYDAGIAKIQEGFAQQRQTLTVGTPCVWEFEQGEALSMFGFFGLYFGDAPIDYLVNWYVDGEEMTGDINKTGGTLATPDGPIGAGWITLPETVPAFDLAPGDYNIHATVSLSSTQGRFFWENDDASDVVKIQKQCIDNPAHQTYIEALEKYNNYLFAVSDHALDPIKYPGPAVPNPGLAEPDFEICGYNSIEQFNNNEVSFAPLSFVSEPELLRILPVSSDTLPDSKPVSTPNPVSLLLLGLSSILLTRIVKKSKNKTL